jgi:hypothetical protein
MSISPWLFASGADGPRLITACLGCSSGQSSHDQWGCRGKHCHSSQLWQLPSKATTFGHFREFEIPLMAPVLTGFPTLDRLIPRVLTVDRAHLSVATGIRGVLVPGDDGGVDEATTW